MNIWYLLIGKLILAIFVLYTGFTALSGDEAARALLANSWAKNPFFMAKEYPVLAVWLPLQTWIVGSILKFWQEIWVVSLLVSLFFTLGAIFFIYLIGLRLYDKKVGLIGAMLYAVLPWSTWLGLSGASEPIYHCFVLGAFYFFVCWNKGDRNSDLWLAATMFLLAGLVRPLAWVFAGVFAMLVLFRCIKGLSKTTKLEAIAASFLALGSGFFWLTVNFIEFDHPLYFLLYNKSAVAATGSSIAEGIVRLFLFPAAMFLISPVLSSLSVVAVLRELVGITSKTSKVGSYLTMAGGAFLVLLIGSFAGFGTAHSPQRFVIIFLALMSPIAAALLMEIVRRKSIFANFVGIALLAYLSCNVFLNFLYVDRYSYAVHTGRYINQLFENNLLSSDTKVLTDYGARLVEGRYSSEEYSQIAKQSWYQDALIIPLYSNHPDRFVDHEWALGNGNDKVKKTSLEDFLTQKEIKLVVSRSPAVSNSLGSKFQKVCRIGSYIIYSNMEIALPCLQPPQPNGIIVGKTFKGTRIALQRYSQHPVALPNSILFWLNITGNKLDAAKITICANGKNQSYCENQSLDFWFPDVPLVFPEITLIPTGTYSITLSMSADATVDKNITGNLPNQISIEEPITLISSKRNAIKFLLHSDRVNIPVLARLLSTF